MNRVRPKINKQNLTKSVADTAISRYRLMVPIALMAVVFLSSVIACADFSSSSTENRINITAQFAEPAVTKANEYHYVSMDGTSSIGGPGEPELPAKGVNILIPAGKKISSFEAILGEKRTLYNISAIKVAPAQQAYPMGQSGGATSPNYSIYYSNSPFPEEVIEEVTTQDMRGYKIATFIFHSFIKDLNIEVLK